MLTLGAALKHWKLIGIGLLALVLGIQTFRLHSTQQKLETARAELRSANERVRFQNERVEALRQAGEQAALRARRDLEAARQESARSTAALVALQRSSRRVYGPSDPCTVSDELRRAQDRL